MRPTLARLLRLRHQEHLLARSQIERHARARHAVDAALADLHAGRAGAGTRSGAELLHEETTVACLGRSAALLASQEADLRARLEGTARAQRQIERLVDGQRRAATAAETRAEGARPDDWQRSRWEG